MTRALNRKPAELRPIKIQKGIQRDPDGSVQISFGETVVLCAANLTEEIPPWLKKEEKPHGWITAEYSMLPGASPGRVSRKHRGRSEEIQRLIGRSLRASCDLSGLGLRTIHVDCDVLQADGGTRVASITGGYLAVALAIQKLISEGLLEKSPLQRQVCAVSCVYYENQVLLDPDYQEDRNAEVDMNLVLATGGELIEIQGTAEGAPFSAEVLNQMVGLAQTAAGKLFRIQQEALP